MSVKYDITADDVGTRLDVFLTKKTDKSRSYIQQNITEGNITVNGLAKNKNYVLRENDSISLRFPEPVSINTEAQDIPLDIVYEDNDILVINKPQGMVVHPAAGNYDGTLVNALLHHCKGSLSGINGKIRPGIVHRIDKDTSGLLIVAKNDDAHISLAQQISTHSFVRRYEAIVCGNIKDDFGTIDLPIGRSKKDRKKYTVTDENSKHAITHFKVLQRFGKYTYVELTLETGRTHQIRVHMSNRGNPVVGDPVYGHSNNEFGLKGQCLFAKYIKFKHPITNEILEFDAPKPEYLVNALKKLGGFYDT